MRPQRRLFCTAGHTGTAAKDTRLLHFCSGHRTKVEKHPSVFQPPCILSVVPASQEGQLTQVGSAVPERVPESTEPPGPWWGQGGGCCGDREPCGERRLGAPGAWTEILTRAPRKQDGLCDRQTGRQTDGPAPAVPRGALREHCLVNACRHRAPRGPVQACRCLGTPGQGREGLGRDGGESPAREQAGPL